MGPALTDTLSRANFGDPDALRRFDHLLDRLGLDRAGLSRKSLHVVGSNGKGTVATYTARLLTALGYRTVLTLSPHVFEVGERIQVDGEHRSEGELDRLLSRVLGAEAAAAADHGRCGRFELFTLAAAILADASDAFVVEAGIGGRHDATRAFGGRIAALVSIDLEHTALLGPTERQIACDKADILRKDGTLIIGAVSQDVQSALAEHAEDRALSLRPLDVGADGIQGANAVLATMLVENWTGRRIPDPAGILSAVTLPGRLQRIADDPVTVIDIGHTPKAAALSASLLRHRVGNGPLVLLTTLSGDKDPTQLYPPLLEALRPDAIVVTQTEERPGDPDVIGRVIRAAGFEGRVTIRPECAAALQEATRSAKARDATLYAAGSLYLAQTVTALMNTSTEKPLR